MPKIQFEDLKDYLQGLAEEGVKNGLDSYPEIEIEVYLAYGYEAEVAIEHGIPKAKDGASGGVGVRIAQDKNLGFAAASGLSRDVIKSTVDESYATMRAISAPDNKFEGFTDPIQKNSKDGIIFKPILDITSADLIERVNAITAEAQGIDNRIVSISGESGVSYGGFSVANSRDVNVASTMAASYIVIQCIAQEQEKRKLGFEFDVSRSRELEWDDLAERAGKHALDLLDTRKLSKSEVLSTVWEPRVGSTFILNSLGSALNGRQVVEGRSRFADRIGEEIARPNFGLVDDGQLPEGLNTSAFDAEGVPRQETVLVEKGTLRSFLFDSYYARIYGTESTGNAKRSGQEPFSNTPNVGISTLNVPPGTSSVADAISDIDEGIYIQDYIMGLSHSDPISGDFSAVSPQSFLIKNGEIAGALEPVTVAGNFYTALLNFQTICKDATLTPWNIKIPTLIIEGLTVSG
ncbi:MAG: TldD/PmbA family protein [Candidatus Heimdallarchaeota archaeon]